MKPLLITIGLLLSLLIVAADLEKTKTVSKTIATKNISDLWIYVSNINGDVEVTGWDGNEVKVELIITVKADNQTDLEKGLSELEFQDVWKDNQLILTMKAPFINDWWNNEKRGWHCNNEELNYSFNYYYKVKVPKTVNVEAATVNEGNVLVSGIPTTIKANNVNGHIDIEGAGNVKSANTVNGHVNVSFTKNPDINGSFHTINGDITLKLIEGFTAEVYSKSMNGEMYSAFDFEYLKPIVQVNKSSSGRGTTYKIGESQGIVIGKGGPSLKLETLNGNMYLKRI